MIDFSESELTYHSIQDPKGITIFNKIALGRRAKTILEYENPSQWRRVPGPKPSTGKEPYRREIKYLKRKVNGTSWHVK